MPKDDAESISIEETNKIRASLGLKPLRVEPKNEAAAQPPPQPAKDEKTKDSFSIEETNKLRQALGLKPLRKNDDEDGAPGRDNSFDSQERRAVDNWKKHQEEADRKLARERRIEAVKKAKETAARLTKLEGKGLADDDDEEDAATWVKKQNKRQKKLAEKYERELAEMEAEAQREKKDYTSKDMAGLRVGHDVEDLQDGTDGTILTLKDATILDNEDEGDELVNTELTEREKLRDKLDLKKKKPEYNPYEEDDDGLNKSVLAKYDEEIDGKKRKHFVLDDTGSSGLVEGRDASRREQIAQKLKRIPINLDSIRTEEASDYVDPSTVKIRKPKKKKAKTSRRRVEDEELDMFMPERTANGDGMEIDSGAAEKTKKVDAAESFVDDDDLSSALALQRKAALKKRKVMKPEDIARQLREESKPEPEDAEGEPALVIDETSEFVSSLRAPVVPERRKVVKAASAPQESPEPQEPAAEKDIDMERGSPEDEDEVMQEIKQEEEEETEKKTEATSELTSTGLTEETTIGVGVAATLKMLKQRVLMDEAADPEAHRKLRERDTFLAKQRQRQAEAEKRARAQRERDRNSGKFDRMSAREREEHARWENRQRDQQEAREAAQSFKDYKPEVNLEYKDEYGRNMTPKEAFKYLSHQFHGKGSGKQKTEKRLKKIEDEKKRAAASSLNPEGMVSTVANAAKLSKKPGVRLM